MPILTEEERIGTLLAGRYQLDAILGRGGQGIVFDATHNWTGRNVAVKLLKPEYSRDLDLTRRFLQEARAAAGLSHPNVVQVLDMGNESDGTVHLVLERLHGMSLGRRLEEQATLPPEETLKILIPIMDALRLAHDRGIIHRDLKPDNIYLHRDDTERMSPKLLDFGMSKMVDAAWGTSTQTGTVIGTPFYMSPEQADGRKEQGPQSDVWSMGVILYRCLTGDLPFYSDSPTKLLLEIVRAQPTPTAERNPEVPEGLARVTDRCLADELDERWPSMEALIEALRDAAKEAGIPFPAVPDADATPPPPASFDPGPRRDPETNRPRALLVGAAVAALVIGGVGVWMAQRADADRAASAASEAQEAFAAPETIPSTAPEPALPETPSPEGEAPAEANPETAADPEEAAQTATVDPERRPLPRENLVHMAGSRGMMHSSPDTPSMVPRATRTAMGTMRLPGIAEDW
ncbi:MAG: serine/threonine protein kinase [Deltaproteobacteria bacterium]|nr:serine/threonine protein kinase [Deltaproteobacteria bacterium]